jgi:twitching motility protein PilT
VNAEHQEIDFAAIITEVVHRGASDLHITAGAPPTVREKGALRPLQGYGPLTPNQTRALVYGILSNDQRQKLEEHLQLDFAYSVPNLARFRINCYFQRNAISAAFRLIPTDIKSIEQLALPPVLHEFVHKPRGIVLVTGPTGSGKSTTLAAVINEINQQRHDHILTIEDPIEFLHRHKNCIVNQREVGTDAENFALGLKAALRQDPDVILVGEMRDLETIGTALTAAETGHLVFGTLHTQDTSSTIDRIIDVFSPEQQEQVRVQLSMALQGIVTQQLLPKADGSGRVCACEILMPTPAIRNLIREAKVAQMNSAIQTGAALGMQTLDQCLADLVRKNAISMAEARAAAQVKDNFPG